LSADDRRLVLTVGPPDKRALWLYDLGGRPPIPLVTEGSDARLAIWSPEGGRVAYVARRGNAYDAFITAADGSGRGSEAVVTDVSGVEGWSADDELILFSTAAGSGDVVAVSLRGDRAARNVVATRDAEGSAAFSPDGRWLAYATNRTGAFELWARRYPDGIPLRVSETGGSEPIWSRDGSELFYRRGTAMMSVAVDPEAQNPFQTPSLLFDGAYIAAQNPTERSYDVAADGRFLMLQTPGADTAQSATIVVIQNWMGEIERTGTR
jgi:Tol biopolymer transport system component